MCSSHLVTLYVVNCVLLNEIKNFSNEIYVSVKIIYIKACHSNWYVVDTHMVGVGGGH